MTRNQALKDAVQFVQDYDEYLLVSHVHPDGDTISSTLAMAYVLKKLGKKFVIINQDPIPDRFLFLPMADLFYSANQVNQSFSHVITLDAADRKRIGDIEHLFAENVKILNIDHHPTNDYFGNINVVVPHAAATAEVMYDFVQEIGIEMDKDLASMIYTGLLTDTGGFRYANTSSKVLRIAAQLLEFGISPGEIAEMALEAISHTHLMILKRAFEHVELLEQGRVAWTVLRLTDLKDLSTASDDTEGVVNYMRNIEGVEVGVFFKEADTEAFKVSLRSKKLVDVGAIAKEFGGGGHERAAGFSFQGPLKTLKSELLSKIKQAKGWNLLD